MLSFVREARIKATTFGQPPSIPVAGSSLSSGEMLAKTSSVAISSMAHLKRCRTQPMVGPLPNGTAEAVNEKRHGPPTSSTKTAHKKRVVLMRAHFGPSNVQRMFCQTNNTNCFQYTTIDHVVYSTQLKPETSHSHPVARSDFMVAFD